MKKWNVKLPASTEYIFLYLLHILNDPYLSFTISELTKNIYISDKKHQKYHENIRMTSKKRWDDVNRLYQNKKFHQMSSVPIDFPLPYGAETWRAYKMTMKKIQFLREGFLKINKNQVTRNMKVSEALDTIRFCNLDASLTFSSFSEEIREALEDFILFEDDEVTLLPYILREGESRFLQIIN